MDRYLHQLLEDIARATEQVPEPFVEEGPQSVWDWISPEQERATAPWKSLEEWTRIKKVQLPPEEMLSDEQIHLIYPALEEMLRAYNCWIIFQIKVPERLQYKALQVHFDQEVPMLTRNTGFFELCAPETPFDQCLLGEYCHCRFYKEWFDGFVDEELSPEEERQRILEMEIDYLKKKHGDDWKRYYPYHLDPAYDEEDSSDHEVCAEDDDGDEDADDWWRG